MSEELKQLANKKWLGDDDTIVSLDENLTFHVCTLYIENLKDRVNFRTLFSLYNIICMQDNT